MAENREKTYVADVDRSIYDIRDAEHDAYRMESGLTPEIVDAVRTVSEGVRLFRERTHGSLLIITHSTRILEALHVDAAHVMENGVIVKNGGAELVEAINEKGFGSLKTE